MASSLEYQGAGIPIEFTSNSSGAPVVDEMSGDLFSIETTAFNLDPGKEWRVAAVSGVVPNTVPNISPKIGNTLSYTSTVATPGTFTITLPTGRYDENELQVKINRAMAANGHGTIALPVIIVSGEQVGSVQTFQIMALGYSVDFTAAGSISGLTGFTGVIGPPAVAGETFYGNNPADYDQGLTSMVVNCDIVAGGIGPAGSISTALFSISPGAGSLGKGVPYQNTLASYSSALKNLSFNRIEFWLSDQRGRRVTANGGVWSGVLMIYHV